MRTVICALVGAALLLPPPARANDASYTGCSGAPAAVTAPAGCVPEKRSDVELVDEALTFREVLEEGQSRWEVEARYRFVNRGEEAALTVGFPIDEPTGEGGGMQGYAVEVDGAAAAWRPFDPQKDGDDAARAAARTFGYDRVYLTDVTFPAGGTREVVHRYSQRASNNNEWMAWHRYLLRTGAHWRGGRIGHIAITVVHARPLAYDHHAVSLKGAKWDPKERALRWEARDWAPTRDLLYVWGIPEAIAWELADLSRFEPEDAAAGPALGGHRTRALAAAVKTVLQVYRDPRLPAKRTYDPRGRKLRETWPGRGVLLPIPPAKDPALTLAAMGPHVRGALLALDRELRARKARHLALPPPR